MLMKEKTDLELGLKVHDYLKKKGKETPIISNPQLNLPVDDRRKVIEDHMVSIMKLLNLDLNDDSLSETPKRIAKMYVDELFYGLNYANFPKCTVIENKMNYDEMVLEKNITIKSMCEHHFIPIIGVANIAYIPNKTVLGLSKLNRIADFFARRPQVQERLTEQIYYALSYILGTIDVAVHIQAQHLCVTHRGVEHTESLTSTAKLGGSFIEDRGVRQEFYNLIK